MTSSGRREGCLCGGNSRELLRKLRNEVLPELLAPMTRTLEGGLARRVCQVVDYRECDSLIWGWVLAPTQPTGVVDSADRAARVTITSAVCHALSSGIGVVGL